jgi:hypothetical protein
LTRAKAQGSFNTEFWAKTADIEKKILQQYREERKVSLENSQVQRMSGLKLRQRKQYSRKFEPKGCKWTPSPTTQIDWTQKEKNADHSERALWLYSQLAKGDWGLCIPEQEKDQESSVHLPE